MEIIGIIAAVFIGITLGMIGAGGGILTVPLMVYLFHVPVLMATSYSLFIVGVTSLLGAFQKHKQGNVKYKVAIQFCLISLLVVYVVRKFVIPVIPVELFFINGVAITSGFVNMVFFSSLMILSSYSMIRNKELNSSQHYGFVPLLICSAVVGLITGLLGAGGGFILIPAMVLLLKIPIKDAIGTSLFIIACNALIGFSLDLKHFTIEWEFLFFITLVTIAGLVLGLLISTKISSKKLKLAFGWFVLIMGILILIKECSSLGMRFYNNQL